MSYHNHSELVLPQEEPIHPLYHTPFCKASATAAQEAHFELITKYNTLSMYIELLQKALAFTIPYLFIKLLLWNTAITSTPTSTVLAYLTLLIISIIIILSTIRSKLEEKAEVMEQAAREESRRAERMEEERAVRMRAEKVVKKIFKH
jgi:hypothetical protein